MRLSRCVSFLSAFAFLLAQPALAFNLPPNDGFVTDTANVLSVEEDKGLEKILRMYRRQHDTEILVLILDTLQGETLENISATVAHNWLQLAKQNERGVVLVFSYTDRSMTILTGDVLVEELPDIVLNGIIDTDIMPAFKDGQYAEGIKAGIAAMQQHISGEYDASRYDEEEQFINVFWYYVFIIFVVSVGVLGYRSRIQEQRRPRRTYSKY